MKTVILAGGRGARLSEETVSRPKPMVEIGGRPILWHILNIYAAHGQVGVFGTGDSALTGGRLLRLKNELASSTFMLTHGDGVGNVDIPKLIEFHASHPGLARHLEIPLVARPLIEVIRGMDDPAPCLRGAIASLGFDQTGIPYHRQERRRGNSKFNFRSLVALAVDGILSTSIIPLRVATFAGLTISFLTVCGIAFYVVLALFYGKGWPSGFATITVLPLLGISVNSLFLGILGEYLGRICKQSKRQPVSILQYSIENGVVVDHAAPPKPVSTESQSSSSGEPQ